jgi:ribosome-associated translation inhibitor RaiA
MNITYTGKHGELPADQQRKLDAKIAKLSKLLGNKGEDKQAHVIVHTERHLTNAKLMVNYYDRQLVGLGSDADLLTALTNAIAHVEEQLHDAREKFRDIRREPKDRTMAGASSVEALMEVQRPDKVDESDEVAAPKVFRIDHHERRKPMTLDEALIAIDGRGYVVYRDTDKQCVSVLIRRQDGNFDLIES